LILLFVPDLHDWAAKQVGQDIDLKDID